MDFQKSSKAGTQCEENTAEEGRERKVVRDKTGDQTGDEAGLLSSI